jgi:hypothetical protein
MSSKAVTANESGIQMLELTPECYAMVFGFLELKELGTVASVCKVFKNLQEQIHSLWTGLFPQINSLDLGVLAAKERAKALLTPIPLDIIGLNRCMLNLYRKTITPVKGYYVETCKQLSPKGESFIVDAKVASPPACGLRRTLLWGCPKQTCRDFDLHSSRHAAGFHTNI